MVIQCQKDKFSFLTVIQSSQENNVSYKIIFLAYFTQRNK